MNDASSALADWTPEQIAQAKRWVENWKEVGPILEELRRQEIRAADTIRSLQNLAGAFEAAAHLSPLRPSSGLLEQQALFQRLKACSSG